MHLTLPDQPTIVYSVFSANSSRYYNDIELARRQIVSFNTSPSFLSSVHNSALYVFLIVSNHRIPHAISTLNDLHFNGLSALDPSYFTPLDIYPCSLKCSSELVPCPSCLNPPPGPTTSSACFLPRQPLRTIYSCFLEAVRDNLIHQISVASMTSSNGRPVKRLMTGFLLGPPQSSSEWGTGWEHHSWTKPLVYCHLQLYMTPSRIIIHPILRPAHFHFLPSIITLASGTPIILLPYATPAYFLTTYTGPTDALTVQFEESLLGLGPGHWTSSQPPQAPFKSHPDPRPSCSYVIAWINVQNKQGEDKGTTVIWPTRLCLSFLPSSSSEHARQPLSYIPELPAQLQPSPPLPTLPQPSITLTTSTCDILPASRRLCRSTTSDSLRAFRSLTFSKSKDINKVASEVSSYVDAVAKEREKERERIRKERETANSSASPKVVATPSAHAPATGGAAPTPGPTVQLESSVPLSTPLSYPLVNPQPAVPTMPNPPHFYPTPPHTNPQPSTSSNHMPASPAAAPPTAEVADVMSAPVAASDPSSSFDPFGNIDSSWTQSASDGFMNMDMDFGMRFSMDVDPITGSGGGGSAYDRVSMDYEDAFTDDDFSFFDRPSRSTAVAVPSSGGPLGSGLTPAAGPVSLGFSPPIFGDSIQVSGPGPPTLTPGQPSPWMPSEFVEGFSPRFTYHQHHHHASFGDLVTLDVLPPSPGQTPSSHSAPASPNVHLSNMYEHHGRRPSTGHEQRQARNVFDPIPFASSHRVADGKYAVGKFALPSPPDEEDRAEPVPLSSSFPACPNGWWFNYNAATDPRFGLLKKLIGVKRKSFDQGSRDHKMSPSWVQEHEDWSRTAEGDLDTAEDEKSEGDSEDEDVEENDASPILSRPSTPLPAYLPLGPALLHTRFHHSQLLPLSLPLRPPGAAVAPTNLSTTVAPTSVPTPVSPAAAMGAASEKSKSLEAAAAMVAREVVENGVWAEAWRAHSVAAGSLKPGAEVWQSDVRSVRQLLERVEGLEGLDDLFQLDSLPTSGESSGSVERLESPMISVGKGDAVIQVLPTALRFWEKLGLGPRGGKKDVTAFVLFEADCDERQQQVESWLAGLSATYAAKRFGTHTLGSSSSCPKDGIFPLRFESFRKNLATFIASLPAFQSSLVVYIVTPAAIMTLDSPLLRQALSAVKRTLKTYTDAQILFQFVPEFVVGSLNNIGARNSDTETLCFSVYDRILQPVDRLMSRQLFEHDFRGYFQEPVFTLARPVHNKVKLVWQAPAGSLDVLDRHTFLHVGYQLSPCGKWILAACVDQRGEAHDIGVWLTQSESNEMMHVVTQVWTFALQFARKANVEWRLVIAKLGSMDVRELDAWMSHLATALPTCHELPMLHVSVLSIEADAPWSFTAPQPSTKQTKTPSPNPSRTSFKDKSGPVFVDVSATTYAQFHSARLPLTSTAPWSPNMCVDISFIPDADDAPPCEDLSILPLSTTTLIRIPSDGGASMSMLHLHLLHTTRSPNSSLTIPDKETHADITRNYHDLAVLAQARCRLGVNSILPFHLAALEAIHVALVCADSGLIVE